MPSINFGTLEKNKAMKTFTLHRKLEKAKEKLPAEIFFDQEGHLNDSGITLYVEALKLNLENQLPVELIQHLEECPYCQYEVFDFYQMMKDEPLESHPYLDTKVRKLHYAHQFWSFTSTASRVAAILFLTVFSCLAYLVVINPRMVSQNNIESPFANKSIQVAFEHFEIDLHKNQTIVLENGSTIFIPAYSFTDETGKRVQGKAKIAYREFYSASDIVASGLPLLIDNQANETAGIFEIRASKGTQVLMIAKDKSLSINMASKEAGNNFHHYFLEENTQKSLAQNALISSAFADNSKNIWRYVNKSEVLMLEAKSNYKETLLKQKHKEADSLAQLILNYEKNIIKIEEPSIVRSNKTQNQSNFFKLSLNLEQNTTLIQHENKIWEYAGENQEESPTAGNQWIFTEKWDNLNISPVRYKALSLKGHTASVNSAVFSPQGDLILTASKDHTAKLWTAQAQYLLTIQGHSGSVNSAVFAPHSPYLLTASDDHTAKIWNKQGECLTTLNGHTKAVKSAVYSADEQFILTASDDHTARLWNSKGQIIKVLSHKSKFSMPQFSPNSRYIALIDSENSAKIVTTDGREIATLKGKFKSIVFSNDSQQLITTSIQANDCAVVWSLDGKHLKDLRDLQDTHVYFSPDNGHLATISGKGARLWKFNNHSSYNTVLIRNMKNMPEGSGGNRKGHEENINALQFSKNGNYIITASDDRTAKIWNQEGIMLHTLRGHSAKINTVFFSPDGNKMLTASDDNTAKIWVEREIKDVFELELVKERHIIEDKGKKHEVAGKRFYTLVREAKEEISKDEIIKPNAEDNLLNQYLEQYNRIVAEIESLKNQSKINHSARIFRQFDVKSLGFHTASKPLVVDGKYKREIAFDLGNLASDIKIKVFQICGKNQTGVLLYEHQANQSFSIALSPNTKNTLVVLLPNDEVAIFHQDQFRAVDSKNILKIENPIKVKEKSKLDEIL